MFLYVLIKVYVRRKLRQMGVVPGSIAPARAHDRGVSRLMFVAVGIALLGMVLLLAIFALFA